MGTTTLILLALGLAMDAAAVSVSNGVSYPNVRTKTALTYAALFGLFQAGMPAAGYLAGRGFSRLISSLDHWIALLLLGFIGGKMIWESVERLRRPEQAPAAPRLTRSMMLAQAVATSIDALAVGITFAFLEVEILPAVACIAGTTFVLSAVGVKLGGLFGLRYRAKAQSLGGLILILLGVKILLEGLHLL